MKTADLIPHLARRYLERTGQSLDDFDGFCGELANKVIGPNDHIIYVEPACLWKYHMVPLIADLIHDAWCDGPPLPLKEWLIRLCGHDEVTVSLDGEDIYSGPASGFQGRNDMPDVIKHPSGGGAIVPRQRRVARCAFCPATHSFLCDYPIGDGKTCDKKLCSVCASKFDRFDYCPEHAQIVRESR